MPASGFAGFAAATGGAGAGAMTVVLVPAAGTLPGFVGRALTVALGAVALAGCAAIVGVTAGDAVFVEEVPDERPAAAPPQPASTRLKPMPPTRIIREGVHRLAGRRPAVRVTRSTGSSPGCRVRLRRSGFYRRGAEIEGVLFITSPSIETTGRGIFARIIGCPFWSWQRV